MSFPVIFEHPVMQQKKILSPGFDFVGFISPLIFGIPLFVRRQWLFGAFCLLISFYIIFFSAAPSHILYAIVDKPDPSSMSAEDAGKILILLGMGFSGIIVLVSMLFIGVKSRKNQAKVLIESGWKVSGENNENVKPTLVKWGIL